MYQEMHCSLPEFVHIDSSLDHEQESSTRASHGVHENNHDENTMAANRKNQS